MTQESKVTEKYSSLARVHLQLQATLRLLADAPDGLAVAEVLRRVRELVPPTEQELTLNASGIVRYDTNLRWWSVNLVKAGWLRKSKGIWHITDSGRSALEQYPNASDLGAESDRLYRVWQERAETETAFSSNWGLVDSVLLKVPPGRWLSFTDLEEATGRRAASIGIHAWMAKPGGWHRLLGADGSISADKYGAEDRSAEQRTLLSQEGLKVDPKAPASARMTQAELLALTAEVKSIPRAWLVRGSSVRGVDVVPQWLEQGFVSLPAGQLSDVSPDILDDDLKQAVETRYDNLGYSQRQAKFNSLRTFIKRMKPGHLVVAVSGDAVYVGECTGEVTWQQSPDDRTNLRRTVLWRNQDSPTDTKDLTGQMLGKLRTVDEVVDLTEVYSQVAAIAGEEVEATSEGAAEPQQVLTEPLLLPDLGVSFAEELLINPLWVDEFTTLLRERRQVILYGPPGTGKTYLAQKVAEALGGAERVKLVQFHPSYAYEDFFEGYRPVASGSAGVQLALVPGPFRKIVDLARLNPSQPYFLIIDEINRANLAKVFGELYFLLEYRSSSIDLLYSSGDTGEAFSMPENVYIIGTMNTADRSIALVDAAMRRRFAFLSLHPEDEKLDQVLRSWLQQRQMPEVAADLLVELNRRIPDKDFKLGPAYLMKEAAGTEAGLERIWRSSILPLLEEFHVGDGVNVKARYGLPALYAAIGDVAEPALEADAQG